ncbi:MAG: hypothetical protein PHF00_11950 [Elusimicrobia bacterium]|nr:hypothetical protein [Elusimicrobiota bacterium]
MPRLWLINVDELAPPEDPHFDAVFTPAVSGSCVRFLFCLEPEDLLVCPVDVPAEFTDYVRGVCGLSPARDMILPLRRKSRPYSLVDSLLEDGALMRRLAELGRRGGWRLEPYIESPRVVALSRKTGIPTDKTHPDLILNGTILALNDKGRIRALARELGVPFVPGYLARDRRSLTAAIDKVSRENGDRVYLRKTRYCGGLGNLSGGKEELLRRLPSWYAGGDVLVEHALEFASVAGTLMTVGHDSVRFWGVDEQRFNGHNWAGFDYPHDDLRASAELCELSLRIANAVHQRRARGDLNLDWGLLRNQTGKLEPVLLECNFRHNGLGQMLRFAQRYFGAGFERVRIRCFIGLRLPRPDMDFAALRAALAAARTKAGALLIDSPGRSSGAVVMMPPRGGLAALALFAESPRGLDEAQARMENCLK